MPSRDWRLRTQDILESITEIEQRTKGMTFEEFAKNQTTVKAVLYDFIIIGEATRNVPKEIQSRYPHYSLSFDGRNEKCCNSRIFSSKFK